MTKPAKLIILAALAFAVSGAIAIKPRARHATAPPSEPAAGLPQLIALGAEQCIPCRMMRPVLDDLRRAFAGRLDVRFYDVMEHRDLIRTYRLNVIPTQIFLDASGRELFRHEGFWSKEDIVDQWRRLGIELEH